MNKKTNTEGLGLHVLQDFKRHPFRVNLFYGVLILNLIFTFYVAIKKHTSGVGIISFIGAVWTLRLIIYTGVNVESVVFPSVVDITFILVILAYILISLLKMTIGYFVNQKEMATTGSPSQNDSQHI